MFTLKPKNINKITLSSLTNLKENLIKTHFSILTINHLNKKNINNNNVKIFKINSFSFYEKNDTNKKSHSDFDKQIKKEIDKADKERERQIKIEEWKKLKNSTYTKDEFENAIKNKDEIVLIEISDKNIKKLKFFKNMCLFFNIPVSLCITFFIDSILPTYVPGNKKHAALWYGLMATDYILFVNGVLILSALANICLNAKYLPKENLMEFTKFNILNKPFVVKEKVETIKRTNAGVFSPFSSLKSKATNQIYALKGIGEWKDIKLYNYLFLLPVVRKEKTEMKDVKKKKAASAAAVEERKSSSENDKKNIDI
jgi:hypothetical protein